MIIYKNITNKYQFILYNNCILLILYICFILLITKLITKIAIYFLATPITVRFWSKHLLLNNGT